RKARIMSVQGYAKTGAERAMRRSACNIKNKFRLNTRACGGRLRQSRQGVDRKSPIVRQGCHPAETIYKHCGGCPHVAEVVPVVTTPSQSTCTLNVAAIVQVATKKKPNIDFHMTAAVYCSPISESMLWKPIENRPQAASRAASLPHTAGEPQPNIIRKRD